MDYRVLTTLLHPLFDLLFLLKRLDKSRLQPVGVFRLEGLFLIGDNTGLAHDALLSILLPDGGEVRLALGTTKWIREPLWGLSLGILLHF